MTITEGKTEIGKILDEEANKYNVSIDGVLWFDDGISREKPPTRFSLQVYGKSGAIADQHFTPDHLTEFRSDNQMYMQVYQKISSSVDHLKPHNE